MPSRNRGSAKMTKYVECWGADKPFSNITDSIMAKNIGLAVSYEALNLNGVKILIFEFSTEYRDD